MKTDKRAQRRRHYRRLKVKRTKHRLGWEDVPIDSRYAGKLATTAHACSCLMFSPGQTRRYSYLPFQEARELAGCRRDYGDIC